MSEWKKFYLPDLFDVQIGGTPSRGVRQYWAEDNDRQSILWVSIADMFNNRVIFNTKEKITHDGFNSSNAKIIPKGILLFSFKLTIGRLAFSGVELTTNEAIAALIPNKGFVEPLLIYYVLPQTLENIIYDTAVKGKTLNKQKISKITFFLPTSLPEQRKIARILSNIDAVIEKTEAAIAKYKAIKQGMMADLFTRGIDLATGKLRPHFEDAPEMYKPTEFGWVPKEWAVVRIGDSCANFINGGTPSTKNADNWTGTIPWITGADFLDTFEIGPIRRFITIDAIKNSSTHVIKSGNILLVTRTGVGKLAIAPFDIAISQDITGIILNDTMYTVGFFYFYLQLLVEEFKKMNQGTSINGIVRNDLENTLIIQPNIEEQEKIAQRLFHIDKMIAVETSTLHKNNLLKQALMSDLLTGKVRVKYDEEKAEAVKCNS